MKVSFVKLSGDNASYTVDNIIITFGEKDVELKTENIDGRKRIIVREINDDSND